LLSPGTVLLECRVSRRALAAEGDGDPYQVRFVANGRAYSCPLYAFQPRTEPLPPAIGVCDAQLDQIAAAVK